MMQWPLDAFKNCDYERFICSFFQMAPPASEYRPSTRSTETTERQFSKYFFEFVWVATNDSLYSQVV